MSWILQKDLSRISELPTWCCDATRKIHSRMGFMMLLANSRFQRSAAMPHILWVEKIEQRVYVLSERFVLKIFAQGVPMEHRAHPTFLATHQVLRCNTENSSPIWFMILL